MLTVTRIKAVHPNWIPTAVLYEEVLAGGYQGRIRILSEYVATFKPKEAVEPLVRFETEPGKH